MSLLLDLHKAHIDRRRRWFARPEPVPAPKAAPVTEPCNQQSRKVTAKDVSRLNLAALVSRAQQIASTLDVFDESRRPPSRIRIEHILRTVASFYHVPQIEIIAHRRDGEAIRPRQIVAYLSKCLTLKTLSEIGRRLGGRDHTTILAAVRKIERLRKDDSRLEDEIQLIIMRLAERHVIPALQIAEREA